MLNMSKMMRRVRGRKKADEEGEVLSDDDDVEEGQIMQEKDDDVELIEDLKPNGMLMTQLKLREREMFEQASAVNRHCFDYYYYIAKQKRTDCFRLKIKCES